MAGGQKNSLDLKTAHTHLSPDPKDVHYNSPTWTNFLKNERYIDNNFSWLIEHLY